MFDKSFGQISHILSAGEIQAVVALAMGHPINSAQLPYLVEQGLKKEAVLTLIREKKLKVQPARLVEKLRALTPQQLDILASGVEKVLSLELSELFGEGVVPSIHVLRREGLIVPSGSPAWGYCVVSVFSDENAKYTDVYHEVILRHDPAEHKMETSFSVDEITATLVDMVKLDRQSGGSTQRIADLTYSCCLHVAKTTGLRHFRVEEARDGKPAGLFPIPPEDLLWDMQRRDLRNLALAGINAPDL